MGYAPATAKCEGHAVACEVHLNSVSNGTRALNMKQRSSLSLQVESVQVGAEDARAVAKCTVYVRTFERSG